MSSAEFTPAGRLEDLLRGAFPESEAEARLQGLARELRSASLGAPASLRLRVGALTHDRGSKPRLSRGRVALALVALTLLSGAALLATLRFTGHEAVTVQHAESLLALQERLQTKANGSADLPLQPAEPLISNLSGGRAQDVNLWIALRVENADEISSASKEAERITREVGGIVASSAVETQGTQGHALLTLRIPVGRLDDAVFQLSRLGTVTGQRVQTEDLQGPLNSAARRIAGLRSDIRIGLAKLGSGQLDAAQELKTRIHLEHLRTALGSAKRERASIARRAAMADLSFRLATPTAPVVEKSEGGVSGAAHKALDVLRRAGSVAVFLALVLSPLVVLAVLLWLVLRARNRRIEARLLAQTSPGARSAEPLEH